MSAGTCPQQCGTVRKLIAFMICLLSVDFTDEITRDMFDVSLRKVKSHRMNPCSRAKVYNLSAKLSFNKDTAH
jgi:hypothetical protein